MTVKKRTYFLVAFSFIFIFLALTWVSAASSVILSDQGTNVTYITNGSAVSGGNLMVQIWDNLTSGNLIYSENFTNAINNGQWSVLLGTNSTNLLLLNFSQSYYKSYAINGQFLNFTNMTGSVVARQVFSSQVIFWVII